MERQRFNRVLGIELKRVRSRSGLSQDELASRTGISRGFISDIERGCKGLSLHHFLTICLALEDDGAELFAELIRRHRLHED